MTVVESAISPHIQLVIVTIIAQNEHIFHTHQTTQKPLLSYGWEHHCHPIKDPSHQHRNVYHALTWQC